MTAPARARRSKFSKWISCIGVSRGTRRSRRPSFSVTSAARERRSSVTPCAMAPAVFIEQGTTIIASMRNEPLAIAAPTSAFG